MIISSHTSETSGTLVIYSVAFTKKKILARARAQKKILGVCQGIKNFFFRIFGLKKTTLKHVSRRRRAILRHFMGCSKRPLNAMSIAQLVFLVEFFTVLK